MRMHWFHLFEYKINFAFDFFLRFAEFAVFFYAWQTILGANATIPGWDLKGLVVLYSLENLFLALILSFALGAIEAWNKIAKGELDQHLARPTISWLMLVGEGMEISLGGWLLGIGGLVIARTFFGFSMPLHALVLIIVMLLLAVGITILFSLMLSALAFWMGRVEFVYSVWEGLFEFDMYPQTVFPWPLQTLTSFTFPFLFAHTIPAMVLLERIPATQAIPWILIEAGILAFNFLLFSWVWKKGVKRYESFGG
ncbi:MAG: ABC-2 family transporter protein [Candidatus Diapherotrites archaeon]|nr:ABC-2 family transporter protein [Candidatus Diapherotrites archaeon]